MGIRNRPPSWLRRPLCWRYKFARVLSFQLAVLGRNEAEHWRWAFALFSLDECEVLGVWSGGAATAGSILGDLAQRGVERIELMSTQDPVGGSSLVGNRTGLGVGQVTQTLWIDRLIALDRIAREFHGRRRPPLSSAVATSNRLHKRLVQAVRRHSPFASSEAAAAFIAQWMERADRCLFETARPRLAVSRLGAVALDDATRGQRLGA